MSDRTNGAPGGASGDGATAGRPAALRRQLAAGERLFGSFVKTPSSYAVEVIGDVGFDFVVIDEEHGPFHRLAIDNLILAARAVGTAPVVRVSDATPSRLLSVLDDGAAGVLVPHVDSRAKAEAVVAACRYRGGVRGFANTTRAGRYGGRAIWEHVDEADASVAVVAMIEDPAAIEGIDEIVSVDGIDAVFIGRGDLTVAYGAAGQSEPAVVQAVDRVLDAARAAGVPVCVLAAGPDEVTAFEERGVRTFILGSDQGFLRQAAGRALQACAPAATPASPPGDP